MNKGPNQIKPADDYTSIHRDVGVKLRVATEGIAAEEPISVPSLLERTARDHPDHAAMVYKNENKEWDTITFSQYRDRVNKIAKSFIKLGLEPHHTVGVLAFNSPEWFVSELAAIHAGGIITGIYTTNSAEAVQHVLVSSSANIVIVDDNKQMEKVHSIRHNLPNLKAIVQTLPPYASYVKNEDGYYKWTDIEQMNTDDVEEEYKKRLSEIAINECCCLVYTSGTVGVPKGVMLNHDNLTWDAYSIGKRLDHIQYGSEVLISYLPLSHVAAQMVDIFLSLTFAATVYFADKDALKGTLVSTLLEARPTRFMGVPRVYEKIQEKLVSVGAQSGVLKKKISQWAKSVTLKHHMDAIEGKSTTSWQYTFIRNVILSKVKQALGLNRCVTLVSAAAPMSPDVKKYFMSLDLPLMEAFGMSETSGAHCFTNKSAYNFDTIGIQLPGAETKIVNTDEKGHGEILIRGRHMLMGYVGELDKTKEAIDEDGWLHTGDIGYIDSSNLIYITGRLKELIITAGGENVPPVPIEHIVKNEIFSISNAFLVGDRRKFLTMLISLKTDMDVESGAPKDELHPETISWLRNLDLHYTKLSQIIQAGPDPKVLEALQEGIDRTNRKATSNAQKIQKFSLLPHDFSVPTGELGPTLKIKRNVVVEKYKDVIEKFYAV